jgi:hypothetical protein
MSGDDVYPGEMDAPHEFDDEAAEALLSGSGRGSDPYLADLFDDMRVAYTSQPPAVGAELAAVLAEAEVTAKASPARRFERMRSSIVAKAGAAAAAVVAATGGLAVAHALPDSMQDAASHIGIGAPAHSGHTTDGTVEVTPDDSTTTTIESTTTTVHETENENDNEQGDDNDQGAVVGTHHGENDGHGENECEADDRGEAERDDDTTPSTVACTPTTETTVPESHDANEGGHATDNENEQPTVTTVPESHAGDGETSGSSGSGEDRPTTPTTTSHSGGGNDAHSGSGDGSSSNDG